MKPIPIALVGKEFWERIVDWEFIAAEGTIAARDLKLFRICDTAEEVWEHICDFHADDALRPGANLDEMMGVDDTTTPGLA